MVTRFQGRARIAALVASALIATTLAGCAQPKPNQTSAPKATVNVVASVQVWANLAQEIGGSYVTAKAIIASPNQDPHAYEATVRDQLAVNMADLTIENGLGYDIFFAQLTAAKPKTTGARLILSKVLPNFTDSNPHVWYSLEATEIAANALTKKIAKALGTKQAPGSAASYVVARHAKLIAAIRGLENKAAKLAHKNRGRHLNALLAENFATDFVASAGIRDATPTAFYNAVESGMDASPILMAKLHRLISDHKISLVVLNAQSAGAQSSQLALWATAAKIPVMSWSELLPSRQSYLSWMAKNLNQISKVQPANE